MKDGGPSGTGVCMVSSMRMLKGDCQCASYHKD